jgi:hypothetical protein
MSQELMKSMPEVDRSYSNMTLILHLSTRMENLERKIGEQRTKSQELETRLA